MRTSSRVIVSVAALACAASLLGCTPTESPAAGTSSMSTAQPGKINSTIYFISGSGGEKQYLTADNLLVTAVTEVVTRQAEATDNRDATSLDFSSEYQYYTPELTARITEGQNSVLQFYQTNQLATQHVGIFWFEVSFDPSLKKSTVKMVDQFVYSKASPSYYAKANLQPTTVLAQQRIYSLSLAGGNWIITNIEASNETKQPIAGASPVGR